MRGENKYFIIFFVSILSILFSSCNLQPVELQNVDNVEVSGFNKNIVSIKVTATIMNPNSKLTLKSSEMNLFVKGEQMGKIIQTEEIVIEGNTTKQYSTIVKVELTNTKGGVMSALSLLGNKKPEMKLNGWLKIKGPFYWKTITISDYPIQI